MARPTPLQDRLETAFVALAFLVMTVGAVAYVATYGSRLLVMDDLTLVDVHYFGSEAFGTRLWSLHNEHRIPLPRLVVWGVEVVTGDVRAASYVSVAMLATAAFLGAWAARHLRGRTSAADAFFPLLWLHTGNCENLLMGFQVSLVLPTLLVSLVTTFTLLSGRDLSPRRAFACAAAVAVLPLCGGPGMLQAPVLALWLAIVAIGAWRAGTQRTGTERAGTARARKVARVLAAGVLATLGMGVLYLLGYRAPPAHEHTTDLAAMSDVALRVLTLDVGQAAEPWWPWSLVFVAGFAVSAVGAALVAARGFARAPEADGTLARWRVAALCAALATTLTLVAGIGFARGAVGGAPGFAARYIGLASPLLASAYLGLVAFAPRALGRGATFAAAAVLVAARLQHDLPAGREYGEWRRAQSQRFVGTVRSATSMQQVVRAGRGFLDDEPLRLALMLQRMCRMRMYPFDECSDELRASADYPMFARVPGTPEGPVTPALRTEDGEVVLAVAGGCALPFDVPHGARRVTGLFGILERAWRTTRAARARFEVVAQDASGARRVLFARVLDANTIAEDRGAQPFSIGIDPSTTRVVLQVVAEEEPAKAKTWIWMRDVAFE